MSTYRKLKNVIFISSLVLSLTFHLQSHAVVGMEGARSRVDAEAIGAMFSMIGGGTVLVVGAIMGVAGIFNPAVLPAACYVAGAGGVLLDAQPTHAMKAPRLTNEMVQAWGLSPRHLVEYNSELVQLDMISETLQAQVLSGKTIKNNIIYLDRVSISEAAQTWKRAQKGLSEETVQVLDTISEKMAESIRSSYPAK